MVTIALSLLAALGYGGADFAAGLAARRASVVTVNMMAFASATAVLAVVVPLSSPGPLGAAALAWGAVSGIGNGAGALALTSGFQVAEFSVAAPLSAVVGTGLTALAGLVAGNRPGPVAWAGLLLAAPAVLAVTARAAGRHGARRRRLTVTARTAGRHRGRRRRLPGAGYGIGAGFGCAVSLIGLGRASASAGLWPVLAAQVTAVAVIAAAGLARHGTARRPGRCWRPCVISGVLAGCAETCFFLAAHTGMLVIAAVVSSLFPAVTVALAAMPSQGERLGPCRTRGLALAVLSVALIAAGASSPALASTEHRPPAPSHRGDARPAAASGQCHRALVAVAGSFGHAELLVKGPGRGS